jgi:GNAT superfamily N-acetyltransferase
MPHIRPLTLEDKPQWLALFHAYLRFYETTLADDVIEVAFQRLLDDTSPQFCAIAESEGKLVGIVHYIFHRSMWTIGDYCYLQDLYVEASERGNGTGAALIERVYAEAKSKNASRVHWLTHETNATARILYDKIAQNAGFIQYRKLL